MIIGIVGAGSDKFTPMGKAQAKIRIKRILSTDYDGFPNTLVSGHSPMKGIDIWSEEIAAQLGYGADRLDIKAPESQSWSGIYGYKERNLDIADSSQILFNIVVDRYPSTFDLSKRTDWCRYHSVNHCYHCHTNLHIKSGGCWTTKMFQRIHHTDATWIVIRNV
jgi:hypothetical protein